jgi:GNAT superfamily N-acetyltransferase
MIDLIRNSQHEAMAISTRASGGRVVDLPGVRANIVPHLPDRSVFNAVTYTDANRLISAIDELAGLYESAEVHAWTVYVPESDIAVAHALQAHGHVLDAQPRAMARELADREPTQPTLPIDGLRVEAVENGDLPSFHSVSVVRGTDTLANVSVVDIGPDCCVFYVATLPRARRLGLGEACLSHALAASADRGCTSSTVWSSHAGRRLYEKCGYRDYGPLQMWERRRPL